MTPFEKGPNRLTSIRKVPLGGNEGYDQYETEQQSNHAQYVQLPVLSDASEIAAHVYLGYRRCCEFDQGNQPGQDYAVVRIGGGYVIGVVADGVSRSFYGNFAAKYVSKWLVHELWRQRAATPDEELMHGLLKEVEAEFAKALKEFRIPTNLPGVLLTALERKRPMGSQAVFAAFVLEVAKAQLTLYQVGDITALIHNSAPKPELVRAAAEGRWSSAGQSRLLLKRTVFENVGGLVVKSDGVSEDWGRTLQESALDEDHFSLMTETRSQLDDISCIAVRRYQVPSSAALTQVAQDEPLPATSSGAESEEPVPILQPSQQQEGSDPVPAAGLSMPPDQIGKTLPGRDVQDISDKNEAAAGKAPQQKKVLPSTARGRQRHIKMFIAGAAAGAVLMYFALLLTGQLKMGLVDGKQIAQKQSNLNPALDKPGDGNITVEVKRTEQKKFQTAYESTFPPLISANPVTRSGEIIARISVEDISVERMEFALNEEERAAAARAREDGGRSSFFVRLTGLAGPTAVTIRLIDPKGNVIFESQERMSGREKKDPANRDPFLGYHEISVRRTR